MAFPPLALPGGPPPDATSASPGAFTFSEL